MRGGAKTIWIAKWLVCRTLGAARFSHFFSNIETVERGIGSRRNILAQRERFFMVADTMLSTRFCFQEVWRASHRWRIIVLARMDLPFSFFIPRILFVQAALWQTWKRRKRSRTECILMIFSRNPVHGRCDQKENKGEKKLLPASFAKVRPATSFRFSAKKEVIISQASRLRALWRYVFLSFSFLARHGLASSFFELFSPKV